MGFNEWYWTGYLGELVIYANKDGARPKNSLVEPSKSIGGAFGNYLSHCHDSALSEELKDLFDELYKRDFLKEKIIEILNKDS